MVSTPSLANLFCGGERNRREGREKTRDLLVEQISRASDSGLTGSARNCGDHYFFAALPAQRDVRFGFLLGKGGVDSRLPREETFGRLQYFGRTMDSGRFLERTLRL